MSRSVFERNFDQVDVGWQRLILGDSWDVPGAAYKWDSHTPRLRTLSSTASASAPYATRSNGRGAVESTLGRPLTGVPGRVFRHVP
jgi:hypothetical protein